MNDYHYYGSPQRSSSAQRRSFEKTTKAAQLKAWFLASNKRKRVVKWLVALLAAAIFVLWLFLGDFRFMLLRLPAFTGFPFGTRTYLVLFQNNYEMRPTGGFISSYGELTFSHGIFTGIQFHDVYGDIDDHETIDPPLIMGTLLSGDGYTGYTFRDANFDPDFTKSAKDLITFYKLTKPQARVDGVFAADFSFLEQLVGRYEPLAVEDLKLTAQNLFEALSTASSDVDRHSEEALATRKDVAGPVVKAIIAKSIWPWRWSGMLKLLSQNFAEKHVLAAFQRPGLAHAFGKRHWDGALLSPDSGDFLAINESNYGGMKSDRYLTRDVQYEIDVTPEKDRLGHPVVQATVTVTLSHEGIWNIPLSGAYTGYLRTLVPLGSDVSAGGAVDENNDDFKVMGDVVKLQPGEAQTFTYSYTLPEYVWNDETYALHLQKQPGTEGDRYRVVVRVPQGMSLSSTNFDVRENAGFYETKLVTDQNLSFTLLPDSLPPRIVSNELTALNQATLVFNEMLAVDVAQDTLNYQVTDMNVTEPGVTDEITVESAQVDGSAITLTLSGMTEQSEEQYEVVVRALKDRSGNVISPNPRTFTVVQKAVESDDATTTPTSPAETPADKPVTTPTL